MAENSKIEWTNNTGSPWLGCTEVSPGCAQCYARELTQTRLEPTLRKSYQRAGFADWKTRPVWGDKATRVLSKGFWENIKRADRAAAKRGERVKHFPSLMDWLDEMPAGIIDQEGKRLDPVAVLADLLKVIHDTPNTDHLLLTKRPENWYSRLSMVNEHLSDQHYGDPRYELRCWVNQWLYVHNINAMGPGDEYQNIWIGTTVEDQKRADERIPELLKIPAKVRFLSVEPQLEEIQLRRWIGPQCSICEHNVWHETPHSYFGWKSPIHWIINGFESGPKKRPGELAWMRSIRDHCKAAGVAYFCKQIDKVQPIPADLMIREFPV